MLIDHRVSDISFVTTSYVYARAQVLTWIANGTSILDIFEKNASDLLSKIIAETDPSKSIVVNFRGITNIDEHSLDGVFSQLSDNDKQLIIINGYSLADSFIRLKKSSGAIINILSEYDAIVIGNSKAVNFKNIENEKSTFLKSFIKITLSGTFKPFQASKRLCSTPIMANGEFNSNVIISDPYKFKWISVFLSDKLEELITQNKLSNVKLISASLRGAPFASILGMFNNTDFETIDHFGPKHKVFDFDFVQKEERGINYIYIGDFVFGGTEIKIAKTYIEMKGSKLEHALVLGSLFNKNVFENDFNLEYLSSLEEITEGKADFKLFENE
jgi:hypothetical protein